MKVPFYKMQGAGNDFILIDNQKQKFSSEQLAIFQRVFALDVFQLAQTH